ncbi:TolC family protein [Phocaeicola barnesiae]
MKNRHWMIGVMCWGAVGLMSGQVRLLRMDEMFQLADRNSKSINLHALAVDEAEQAVRVARNGQLPTIQAAMEFKYIGDGCMTDRDFTNGIHADMPHYGNSFVVKASQVVYAGGRISRSIEQAELNRQVSELEYRKKRQDVRFLLLGHYLDLYQLHNQQVVYQKNIEQTRLLVKDMQAAYRQGTALKSDITRYELQLQNLELGLTSTLNQIDVLNHRLVTTLGLEPGVHLVPDTAALRQLSVDAGQEGFWQSEAKSSPQMQIAGLQVELGKNSQQLIRSERRPHISLVAANDFTGPILVEVPPLDKNFTYWYAGVGISYNFDALFKSKRKLQQAKLHTRKMEAQQELVAEELDHTIHKAYVDLKEAYIRLRTQEKSLQLAHENFHIVRQRYLNGLALITDMLDASNTQLDTELQLANDQIEILYQYYLLKKITGTL